jgi:hypothetical protein
VPVDATGLVVVLAADAAAALHGSDLAVHHGGRTFDPPTPRP